MLRQINELVDFDFIYEELKDKYCLDNGRNAIDPIRMFKYLLLKAIFELSDVDIVKRSRYDLSVQVLSRHGAGRSGNWSELLDEVPQAAIKGHEIV